MRRNSDGMSATRWRNTKKRDAGEGAKWASAYIRAIT